MTTAMPEGEDIRRAVRWISDVRKDAPQTPASRLVEDAATRFNLSPAEEEFLARYIKDNPV